MVGKLEGGRRSTVGMGGKRVPHATWFGRQRGSDKA